MDIKPYWDKLIKGVKNAIVELIMLAIGSFIGVVIAGHWYERHSWNWFVTMFVVMVAYMLVLWLLQLAWSRYRRSSN
jgi:predicted MFS family arabinose efflux permease